MPARKQAELEALLKQRWADVENGKKTPKQAFSKMTDWVIQLGTRKVFLHPNLKQWMWHDELHNEWVYAGCGVDEGILLTIGKTGCVKKLPEPGKVGDWCIYKLGKELHGPIQIDELRDQLNSQQISEDILVWSTRAADWFSLTDKAGQDIIFSNKVNEK